MLKLLFLNFKCVLVRKTYMESITSSNTQTHSATTLKVRKLKKNILNVAEKVRQIDC